jgi:hypothetical protein
MDRVGRQSDTSHRSGGRRWNRSRLSQHAARSVAEDIGDRVEADLTVSGGSHEAEVPDGVLS